MVKILFVCTGNIFRSMIAEKCLNKYVKDKNISNIRADSAGIGLVPQKPRKGTLARLSFYGIEVNHKPKDLTQDLIKKSDLVIAMNTNHKKFIKEKFGLDVPLFNEVAYGKSEGILDFEEHIPEIHSMKNKKKELKKYAFFIVDYIHDAIPNLIKNLDKWIAVINPS